MNQMFKLVLSLIVVASTLVSTVAFANDINGDGRADWVTINPAAGAINVETQQWRWVQSVERQQN